jgi:diguanylate cyclase (GGDEF)-like protein/PAS domain S-box-containing protein
LLSHDSFLDILQDMFDLSPTALCITTADGLHGRYVKVNDSYLNLIGKTWEELQAEPTAAAAGTDLDGRMRRLHLLETEGLFRLEEVWLRHSSGRLIPTLVSCHRRVIDGLIADISIIVDISERKDFENRLVKAAFTDAMTDLPNRAAFDRELHVRTCNWREGECIGLAFIDLNGFKAVNDRYGHAIGDNLLKIVAMRLRARTKLSDFVARLGGDEFGVLFEFPSGEEAEVLSRFRFLAHNLCTAVRIGNLNVDIGAAVGLATETQPTTPDRLLDDADKLMYLAKATRERVSVLAAA